MAPTAQSLEHQVSIYHNVLSLETDESHLVSAAAESGQASRGVST